MAAILKNWYDVITPLPIVWLIQNLAGRCTTTCRGLYIRWNEKPEISFQNGGRPFSETGSSFISAVNWSISSKLSRRIHFHLLKLIPSLNLNPEVHFRLYGRHLEKSIWRHYSAANCRTAIKFGRWMQNGMSKSKPEVQFQYGGLPFSETGNSFILAVHWDISSKF